MLAELRWKILVWKSRIGSSAKIAVCAPLLFFNWPYFFASRFYRKPGVLRLRNGTRFWIRPRSSDRASITEIHLSQPYSFPQTKGLVIDIGANIGAFTIPASRRSRVVYAIEPIASNYQVLCQNCELNQAHNVISECIAISDEDGIAEISVNGVMSSLHWHHPGTEMQQVKTLTLETFLKDHGIDLIDFVKMDCEGAEWGILLKSSLALLSRIRHIELEYHSIEGRDPATLVDRLKEAGFIVSIAGNSSSGIIVAMRRSVF